jgi:hypothetical protein
VQIWTFCLAMRACVGLHHRGGLDSSPAKAVWACPRPAGVNLATCLWCPGLVSRCGRAVASGWANLPACRDMYPMTAGQLEGQALG